jgi:hypothetical protein
MWRQTLSGIGVEILIQLDPKDSSSQCHMMALIARMIGIQALKTLTATVTETQVLISTSLAGEAWPGKMKHGPYPLATSQRSTLL